MMKRNGRREATPINTGSMADIAFLLLIFFLVTTTIMSDKGIPAKLPPWTPEKTPQDVRGRNVFSVKINAKDQLLVEGQEGDLELLKHQVKTFIINPERSEAFSTDPKNAVISLQNDRSTSFNTYIAVYNELQAAYNEIWDEMSRSKFGQAFEVLDQRKKKSIRDQIPLVISEAEPTEYAVN